MSHPAKTAEQADKVRIPSHPFADIFPLMEGAEFKALIADIREKGLGQPILCHEGKVLDGRNRYRACLEIGVEAQFVEYEGDSPLAEVISRNARRRHLNESQRAMTGARLSLLEDATGKFAGVTQKQAAKTLNVSERSVRDAVFLIERAAPELLDLATKGEVAVSSAALLVREYDHDRQRDIAAQGPEYVGEAAAIARRMAKKKERRQKQVRKRTKKTTETANSPPVAPDTPAASANKETAPFRTDSSELQLLEDAFRDAAHEIAPDDLIVDPKSKSVNARQSEYGILRVPHSHPRRDELKKELKDLADNYNTRAFFKVWPGDQHSNADSHEGGDADQQA